MQPDKQYTWGLPRRLWDFMEGQWNQLGKIQEGFLKKTSSS